MTEDRENAADDQKRVSFHYIKSNHFRIVHADGAHGGLQPRGHIEIFFFSERFPIPRLTVNPVTDDGKLGDEIRSEREVRDGVVREVEVGVFMNVHEARSLVQWLQDKIAEHEKMTAKKDSSP
jgi:hypothetical protein